MKTDLRIGDKINWFKLVGRAKWMKIPGIVLKFTRARIIVEVESKSGPRKVSAPYDSVELRNE